MRNLNLRSRFHLDNKKHLATEPLTACAWDNGSDSVVCAYGPSASSPLLTLGRWTPCSRNGPLATSKDKSVLAASSSIELITSFDAPCPLPDLSSDKIISLYFLPEKSTICLVLAGGDIILVREAPLDHEEKIEIVGSVDAGITAAEWSPDGELLVLATRANTLLFMTRELENSTSAEFSEDDLKTSKHVSVGWGKKETQFTGRGARALRDPTMPERVDEGVRSRFDGATEGHGETTISWRGDGQYFAVNSRQASSRRVIRVYSRDGLLDGVSEPVDNLEAALSWRPAGNLMAGIQRYEDRVDVVFFERNGLRHGQYTLRCPGEEQQGRRLSEIPEFRLEWNHDSTVLAIAFRGTVQFWTMGNYHWYLKQELIYSEDSDAPTLDVSWDPESPLRCICISSEYIEMNRYSLSVTRGSTSTGQSGTVAVIDGKTLKLTALKYANVPPPMAQMEITGSHGSIMDASIVHDGQLERVAIVDSCGNVEVFEWSPRKRSPEVKLLYQSEQKASRLPDSYPRFKAQFESKDSLVVLQNEAEEYYLRIHNLATTDVQNLRNSDIAHVQELVLSAGADSVQLIGAHGTILPRDSDIDPNLKTEGSILVPAETDQVEIILALASRSEHHKQLIPQESVPISSSLVAISLTRNNTLYANRKIIARDATSFATSSAHLIYTTSKHMLKFVHLKSQDQFEIPPDTPELDERCRAIERGARIVTIIPETAAVVLQMPRGNLETIFPRALVLAEIRRSIDRKEYKKAFMICRKQRVDMNILYDYSPEQLLSHVDLFVEQIRKVEHIDLFLSQLRDEDVSTTMYKDTLPTADAQRLESEHQAQKLEVGKVNKICDAFLSVLRMNVSTNLQNIITAHVCKSPPDIEAGLTEVAKLQREGEEAGERAVEHICFLVDVNRLYDSALGLYDLELALLVAQQSQKDPREYLPFLQRLRDLPPLRRQFDIDDHLNRREKALASLWALNDFDAYTKYVAKHDLYEASLAVSRYDEARYKQLMALYADHLLASSRYLDAGIAYSYLSAHASASEAYRLAHRWQESLSHACLAEQSPAQLSELATILSDSLTESKEFHAAATIHQDYLADTASAARLFCRGNWFSDAVRLLSLHGKASLIEDIVDAGLTESMGSTTELLAECKGQLNAQVPRLRELRIKKAAEPLAFLEGTGGDGGLDIPDNISLAATDASTMGGSLFTRYTGKTGTGTVATNATRRTAKQTRREQRKRARGKKGSVYEEEYLVNSIGRLMERVNDVGEETQRLVVGLMGRGMRERARAVDAAMREVVGLCTECHEEVFQVVQQEAKQDAVPRAEGDAAGMDDEFAEVPPPKVEVPVLKSWAGLAILGR